MDVALRVAERVTMMHDGRVIVEGTPDEIRANELVHDLYLGSTTAMRLSRSSRSRTGRVLRPGASARTSSFEMGTRAVAVNRPERHGQDDALRLDHGARARATGSIRFRAGAPRPRSCKIAGLGIGYVPQGRRLFPSLSVDEHLPDARAERRGEAVDPDARLRALPASRRAEAERRRAALRRRAADARDRPRAPDEPRAPRSWTSPPRASRPRSSRHDRDLQDLVEEGMAILLVEQNLGVATVDRRAAARDGLRPDRGRDDGGGARRGRRRSAGTSASSRSRPDREGLCRPSSWWERSTRRGASTRSSPTGSVSTASTCCSSTRGSSASRSSART